MHLWILRHGEAERETQLDSERALTERGRGDARAAGEYLAGVYSGSTAPYFLASPYRRAQQTAQCALQAFPDTPLQTADWLIPDADPMGALQALAKLGVDDVVLVSHQPLVSAFGGLLTAGDFRAGPPMGTASLAEFELELVARGCATLISLRHPPEYIAVTD